MWAVHGRISIMTLMNPMFLKRDDEMDSPNSDGDLVELCCLYQVDGSRVLSTSTLCKVVLRSVPKVVEVHVCVPTYLR